jgi:hypothetical protein
VIERGYEGHVAKEQASVYEGGPDPAMAQGEAEGLHGRGRRLATSVRRALISRAAHGCGRLPAVSLLAELDAFYLDHRRCAELDAGVDWPVAVGQHGAAGRFRDACAADVAAEDALTRVAVRYDRRGSTLRLS